MFISLSQLSTLLTPLYWLYSSFSLSQGSTANQNKAKKPVFFLLSHLLLPSLHFFCYLAFEKSKMAVVRHKAAIHSGHFMVSDFEPDEQDEQEEVQVVDEGAIAAIELKESQIVQPRTKYASGNKIRLSLAEGKDHEISLTSLFKSMSMKYRFQLTSPRWNRFRGLKLRWKDKIRMNNVIWRCWHMQFVQNDPKSLCAFANPMEIDNHRYKSPEDYNYLEILILSLLL